MPKKQNDGCGQGCAFLLVLGLVGSFISAIGKEGVIFLAVLVGIVFVAVVVGVFIREFTLHKNLQKKHQESVESHQAFLERQHAFRESSEYLYVKQFAKKYPEGDPDSGSIDNLNSLLSESWNFSTEQWLVVIEDERKVQAYISFKERMLSGNPISLDETARRLLSIYGENYEAQLPMFTKLVYETRGEEISETEAFIKVEEIKKQVEVNRFRERLFSIGPTTTLQEIDLLPGYEFERILKRMFEKMGYQVEQTKLSGDQGADLVLVKFGERVVVQAKRYSGKVGNWAVQEIAAAVNHYQGQRGMVVTNSYFTPAAKSLAQSNGVELIERDTLEKWVNTFL